MFIKLKVLIFYLTFLSVFPFVAIISFDIGFLIADPLSLIFSIMFVEFILFTAFLNNIVYETNDNLIIIADTQVVEEKSLAH